MPQGEMGGASHNGQDQSGAAASTESVKADAKNLIGQLEAMLDEYMVTKAPFALPLGLKEFLVKVSPYVVIVFAVMALPLILAALGMSATLAPFGMMSGYGYGYGSYGFMTIISLAVSAITIVMYVMAVPGLFKQTKGAWRLMFYVSIISLIGSILSFNIIGGIISAVIGWYILFQLKDMYKN